MTWPKRFNRYSIARQGHRAKMPLLLFVLVFRKQGSVCRAVENAPGVHLREYIGSASMRGVYFGVHQAGVSLAPFWLRRRILALSNIWLNLWH